MEKRALIAAVLMAALLLAYQMFFFPVPQEPPALNLSAPVLDSNGGVQAPLPEAQAATRRSGGPSRPAALGLGAVAVLALLGGGLLLRRRGSRARPE